MAPEPDRCRKAPLRARATRIADGVPPNAPAWLWLFHPDGPSGSDRPPRDGLLEVAGLVATAADLETPGALDRALAQLAREIDVDGIGYVVVPRGSRLRAARLATRHGLDVGPWLLHLPSLAASQHVVPIEPRALRYALGTLLRLRPWMRRLLLGVVAGGGTPVLPLLLPSAGLVVRRPGARPLVEWLFRFSGTASPGTPVRARGTAVAVPGWRAGQGSVVVHRLRDDEAAPDVIAKVAPVGAAASQHAEWDNLARFGPAAGRAGVAVPLRVALTPAPPHTVLVQTAVPGRPAAVHLASAPSRLPRLVESLTRWLGRWHAITRVEGATSARVARLLDGLDRLGPHVSGIAPYRRWLLTRCEALSATSCPLVSAHNDLTLWNVLVDDGGSLGIVDWEHATADALPLTDFFYAITDAVMAAGRHTDRRAAAAACVGPRGHHASLTRRHWEQLATDLGLGGDLVTLAFHACWIHHGANAQAEPGDMPGTRAFIDIVRWLAADRVELGPGGRG